MDTKERNEEVTHQDIYEWWRSKRDEISKSIEELEGNTELDPEVLSVMKDLLGTVKIRRSIIEYFDEEIE